VRVPDIPGEPAQANDNPPQGAAGVIDEWVAWNVRIRRENLGWSQADLAGKMAALGWKYHPQTVHRVESGQRKVTIGEAEALARIFGTTVDTLTWPDMVTQTAAWLGMFIARADAAFERIAEQTRELLFDREHLERALAEIARQGTGGHEDVRAQAGEARSVLDDAAPEQAVGTGRERYAEWLASAPADVWAATGRDHFPAAPWLEEPDVES
jgi:transcriptional regulator with XRE-family HTH domain